MGPFLAAGSGETTEWCDSGVEGWKKQEEGGEAKDKEAEESGEGGGKKKRKG